MAKPTLVVNANKAASSGGGYTNRNLFSTESSSIAPNIVNKGSAITLVNNATNYIETVGSTKINGTILCPSNSDYIQSTFGSNNPRVAPSAGIISTYGMGASVTSNAFFIAASTEKVEPGKTFTSGHLLNDYVILTGTGVTADFTIELGLMHTDGTIDYFCSATESYSASTNGRTIQLLNTSDETSIAGDRLAFKVSVSAITGTHDTSNYMYFRVGTQSSSINGHITVFYS